MTAGRSAADQPVKRLDFAHSVGPTGVYGRAESFDRFARPTVMAYRRFGSSLKARAARGRVAKAETSFGRPGSALVVLGPQTAAAPLRGPSSLYKRRNPLLFRQVVSQTLRGTHHRRTPREDADGGACCACSRRLHGTRFPGARPALESPRVRCSESSARTNARCSFEFVHVHECDSVQRPLASS